MGSITQDRVLPVLGDRTLFSELLQVSSVGRNCARPDRMSFGLYSSFS